ncbi:MAG: VTT domain-containing protein [Candidatus Levybacteria bacterium]|nr:VTT domain-containing protein [Candidatus Levybacteria bacterium]
MKKKQQSQVTISSILVFLVSCLLILVAYNYREQIGQFRSYGLFGIFLINFFGSSTIFFPVPSIASVVVGGSIYPPILVAFFAALGASLGDMIAFIFGSSGKKVFLQNMNHHYHFFVRLFKKYGSVIIFLMAFFPNPFFDGVGILAGIFSYSPLRFFLLMFFGRLLRNIILSFGGSIL